jgi:flagellar hook assembly protein FlgD
MLRVYDVRGRHVKTLLDDAVDGGLRNVVWDGTDNRNHRVGSGVYFYQLRVANTVLTRTMVLLK